MPLQKVTLLEEILRVLPVRVHYAPLYSFSTITAFAAVKYICDDCTSDSCKNHRAGVECADKCKCEECHNFGNFDGTPRDRPAESLRIRPSSAGSDPSGAACMIFCNTASCQSVFWLGRDVRRSKPVSHPSSNTSHDECLGRWRRCRRHRENVLSSAK